MTEQLDAHEKVRRVAMKARQDPEFRAKLESDPHGTLKQEGIKIPPHVDVKIVENSESTAHLVLPALPAGEALSQQDLEQVAGGEDYVTDWTSQSKCCF